MSDPDWSQVAMKLRAEQVDVRRGIEKQLLEARRLFQSLGEQAPAPLISARNLETPNDGAGDRVEASKSEIEEIQTFRIRGVPGNIDHAGMVDDLYRFEPHFRSGKAQAPLAVLTQLGGDLLYAKRNDEGAWRIRRGDKLHRFLSSLTYGYAFGRALHISWMHLTIVLGRRDLHSQFMQAGRLDLETAMKWLVLHGMDEHRLWRFVDRRFIREVRSRAIPTDHGAVSPLDFILLRERDDLRGAEPLGSPKFQAEMDRWIEANGVHEYKLFWLLDDAAYARIASAPASRLLNGASKFVKTLLTKHETGQIDIYIAPMDETAKRLSSLTRLSAEDLNAAQRLPIDDTAPEDNGQPGTFAPMAFTEAPFYFADFLPGDEGGRMTMSGLVGRATAEGSPLASANHTFFFAAPGCSRIVVLLDMRLTVGSGSVLVRVNGKAADIFSAAALERGVAKAHAEASPSEGPLTIELECLIDESATPKSGARAWLKSLAVFRVLN